MAGINAGRSGFRWVKLKANLRAQRRPCWLCGQPINYDLPADDPESFSVDHMKPRSTHPHLAEDPSNLGATHLRCNKSRGVREPQPTIGATSRNW